MQCRRHRFSPRVGKITWSRAWEPTLVFLPGKSHGQRNLMGCSSWDRVTWLKLLSMHACYPTTSYHSLHPNCFFFHCCPSQPGHFSSGPLLQPQIWSQQIPVLPYNPCSPQSSLPQNLKFISYSLSLKNVEYVCPSSSEWCSNSWVLQQSPGNPCPLLWA